MKKMNLLVLVFLLALAGGCSNNKGQAAKKDDKEKIPEAIEVKILLPDHAIPQKEVVLGTRVTQSGENVEDADSVKFEIKEEGSKESEMLPAKHTKKGIYEVRNTFMADGVYSITAHVTARDMHNMPTEKLAVGNAEEPHDSNKEDSHHDSEDGSKGHDHKSESEHGEAGHHDSSLDIHLMTPQKINTNEEAALTVILKDGGHPLTEAKVRLEIWKKGAEKHEFLDTAEAEDGTYKLNRKFSDPGNYEINVHVNKGKLHEHKQQAIAVH
ncbi:FixH family protein [Mesobacillus zeae]|uniref:YtkA-like domain-containing protein n=1 Tax=Mesobacillus zeae TaxID=1917180 RepID=A0A398B947_9BACI|nr:FixH family protein [Mesobacillus zeae]RID84430.1 hypothetical protein D1970_12925 [Mesobacillus zeae]